MSTEAIYTDIISVGWRARIIIRATNTYYPGQEVWTCSHSHETIDDANKCAVDELTRRWNYIT
jgi:hypothetical protein